MDGITRKVYVYHSMPSCSANRISASGRLVVSRAAFPLCRCSWDVYFAVNCLQLGFCCQWMGGNTIAVLIILSSIAAVSWCHQPISLILSGWLQVGRQWSAIGTKVSPVEMLGFGLFLYFVMLPRPRYSEDLQTILFSRSDFCCSVTHVTFNMFVWASWCNTNVLIIHYYLQFSLF